MNPLMRIGLITDTHMPDVIDHLPPRLTDVFHGVDLILHAGDIYNLSVLDDLERIAPVLAALGDDDHYGLLKDQRVKQEQMLELAGYRVWLVHEAPGSMALWRWWLERVFVRRRDSRPDVIVHGHSHHARIRTVGGVLTVGSGSPTFLNYKRGPGSVAILELGPYGPRADIVRL